MYGPPHARKDVVSSVGRVPITILRPRHGGAAFGHPVRLTEATTDDLDHTLDDLSRHLGARVKSDTQVVEHLRTPGHLVDEVRGQWCRDVGEVRALDNQTVDPLFWVDARHERHLATEIEVWQNGTPNRGDEGQRSRESAPAPRTEVEVDGHVTQDSEHRLLGVHHALRTAGGPTREADDGEVVRFTRHLWRRGARVLQ